jgi:DNA-binding MarR family transcriptional regulator
LVAAVGAVSTDYDDAAAVASAVAVLYPAIYRRARPAFDEATGITPKMVAAIQHLHQAGPLTVGEQADHHGLSKPAMTELVDRLERRGLVARLTDERDRRRVFVWLTDAGRHQAERSLQVLDVDVLTAATKHLGRTQRRNLVLGLRALVRSLEGDDR